MYNALIVDDEPRTIDALEKHVDWLRCGIRQMFRAGSMAEALAVVQRQPVQVLICDIEMPNGSGLDLLETLTEQGQDISCIFVTCHPDFPYMRRAIQLQCYDYILKPIRYEEFTRVLQDLVRRMEARERGDEQPGAANWGGISDAEIRALGAGTTNVEKAVKTYIREHMADDFSVAGIAEALHFNPQALTRAFKKQTGRSILEYVTEARMSTARKILQDTDLPIREVAQMVGYDDYAYFTRVFRKEMGQTPSQYRGSFRGEAEQD